MEYGINGYGDRHTGTLRRPLAPTCHVIGLPRANPHETHQLFRAKTKTETKRNHHLLLFLLPDLPFFLSSLEFSDHRRDDLPPAASDPGVLRSGGCIQVTTFLSFRLAWIGIWDPFYKCSPISSVSMFKL